MGKTHFAPLSEREDEWRKEKEKMCVEERVKQMEEEDGLKGSEWIM